MEKKILMHILNSISDYLENKVIIYQTFVSEYMSVEGVSQNDYSVTEALDSIYESYDAE